MTEYLGEIYDGDVLTDIFIYNKNILSQDANVSTCNNEGKSHVTNDTNTVNLSGKSPNISSLSTTHTGPEPMSDPDDSIDIERNKTEDVMLGFVASVVP